MTGLARFRALLEAYGAEARRWPAAERAGALALLQESPEAEAARIETARLDSLLDRAPPTSPPRIAAAELARRVTVASQETVRPYRIGDMLWLRAVGLAAAALVGLVVGASQLADFNDSSTDSTMASVAPIDVAEVSPW
jgi:hypothetical protein